MAKPRRVYVCRECGAEYPSWTGRCQECQAWASVGEVAQVSANGSGAVAAAQPGEVQSLATVEMDLALPFPVGIDEIDRVLGGGLTPGSVTLLAGEPGVGKSTLTLQMAMSIAVAGSSVLLVAGEEAPTQVAARAARLGTIPPTLMVVDDLTTDAVIASMRSQSPQLVVIDSVQTLSDPEVDSSPGSVSQVKAVAGRLVAEAKRSGVSVLLVGHVTKEGSIAGPRVLEHMVDTVLSFDGERHNELRFLRTIKHRFGATNEVGIFDMKSEGLLPVPDPSTRYLQDRQVNLAGSVIVPTLSGRRPVLVELQALAVDSGDRPGQIRVQGVDGRRAALVSAVLASRAGYRVQGFDLFLSAAGGATVDEPAADLGMALAIASAIDGQPVSPDVVVCGEIGLGGELRSIPLLEQRLQESYRMGFRTAVAPPSTPAGPTGLRILRQETLGAALAAVPQSLPA
ncbi:MAG: DNA repair protein RadA [Acidimicrobiales bacterium]